MAVPHLGTRLGRLDVMTGDLAGTQPGPGGWPEPWNHNVHYQRVILHAIPVGAQHALDVGCGQGGLTRQLRRTVPQVTGIDRDERSIQLARAHPAAGDIAYLLGDFRTTPLEPGSFDLVTSVAAVHHMDTGAALRRMAGLLRPGGVLAVVGLARDGGPADLGRAVPAILGTQVRRVVSAWRLRGSARPTPAYTSPVVWPPPLTYREVRRLAGQVLPGVRYRRHLYWRYSLVWAKPSDTGRAG
jgi:SAM-dependent methyltransferase